MDLNSRINPGLNLKIYHLQGVKSSVTADVDLQEKFILGLISFL